MGRNALTIVTITELAVFYDNCSPFDAVDNTRQFSHVQQSAFTDHTSAPLYANETIANSGTLYEEICTDRGAGTVRVMVRALYDYEAVEDDELSLTAGNGTSSMYRITVYMVGHVVVMVV